MQVFMPYANPTKTAKCLDSKRLNKQILECLQILSANLNFNIGWKIPGYVKNHPITKLWKNHEGWLLRYLYVMILEWKYGRWFKSNNYMKKYNIFLSLFFSHYIESSNTPKFITLDFIRFYRNLLYNKDPIYYKCFENN